MSYMFLHLHLKLVSHNMKTNGKIHANKSKFRFLYTDKEIYLALYTDKEISIWH